MPSSAVGYEAFPTDFTIGLLDDHHQPKHHIFIFPIDEAPERLHPSAVKSLRVLEIIRLVSLFLGVLTFSLELPTAQIPSTATWISTHEQVQTLINDEDITKNLGDACVADWTGRVLWLRIHGQQPGLLSYFSFV
jgi:hypothetical protein